MKATALLKKIEPKVEPLETITAPTFCQFSPVQFDLEKIARNQQKIYNLLQKLLERIENQKPIGFLRRDNPNLTT